MKKALLGARYVLIVAGFVLIYIGLAYEQNLYSGEGFSTLAKIINTVLPIIFLILLGLGDFLYFRLKWNGDFIGYIALFGLFIVAGFTPLANLFQGVNIFAVLPIGTISMFLFLIALILTIVYDCVVIADKKRS